MTRCLTCLIFVTTASPSSHAAPLPKEIRKYSDEKMILGKWKTEKLSSDGIEKPINLGVTFFQFIEGGKCNCHAGPGPTTDYTIDQSATPRRMTWGTWMCVYEIKGDVMLLCFINAGTDYPKAIQPAPNLTIYTLSRVKE